MVTTRQTRGEGKENWSKGRRSYDANGQVNVASRFAAFDGATTSRARKSQGLSPGSGSGEGLTAEIMMAYILVEGGVQANERFAYVLKRT